jgi:sterol desaturase/sphingolipid hydroxylase (fatty acid hydroxylase superfamily)
MPWAKYISVVLASMLKFVAGPLAGIALRLKWWETAVCTVIGMMLSVVIFVFLGAAMQLLIRRYRKQKARLFTKRNRLAVKVWQRSGMTGIALLTPLLFTPIGGTLIAVSFKVPRYTIILQMLFWGVIWGIVITLVIYRFRDFFR